MKKTLIFLIIFIAFFHSLHAQTHQIGIKSGINFSSTIENQGLSDFTLKCGYHSGFTYNYKFSNGFGIGADLLYSEKGYKVKYVLTNQWGEYVSKAKAVTKYHYISIPIKANYQFGNKFFGFVSLGIAPSFAVAAHASSDLLSSVTLNLDIRTFDLGVVAEFGGGYTFKDKFSLYLVLMGDQSILRYNRHLYRPWNSDKNYKVYNSLFNLSIGFKYSI